MDKDHGNEKAEWIGRALFEKSFLTTGERVDRCARACLVTMMSHLNSSAVAPSPQQIPAVGRGFLLWFLALCLCKGFSVTSGRAGARHDPPMKVIFLGELSLPSQESPEVQVMAVIAAWPPAVILEVWRCLAG